MVNQDKYDKLISDIKKQIKENDKRIAEYDSRMFFAQDIIAGDLIGRKFAYLEFQEVLKGWIGEE